MEIFTEDKASVASSVLLSKMRVVGFSGSNTSLNNVLCNPKETVIYMDVVPDNKRTVDLFDSLCSMAGTNIHIVPVPCIEYFILLLLKEYGIGIEPKYDWLDKVYDAVVCQKTIGKPLPPKRLGYSGSFNSFEKQCKLVLSNCSDRFLNFDTEGPEAGRFIANSWYLTDSTEMVVMTKSTLLWCKLPGVVAVNNRLDIDLGIIIKYKKKYLSWLCQEYKKLKLPDNWWL